MISYLNFQANRSKSSAIIRILAIQKQVRTFLLTLTLSTEQLLLLVFSRVFSNSFFWRFSKTNNCFPMYFHEFFQFFIFGGFQKTIKFLVETSQNMSSHFNVVNWATVAPCVFTSFFFHLAFMWFLNSFHEFFTKQNN